MQEILQQFAEAATNGEVSDVPQWYRQILLECGVGLNSTLRNLLLAVSLNETVLKETAMEAKLVLGQYTWKELKAKVAGGEIPDLPNGTQDKM
jgi:hypothetical protein